MFYFIFIFIYVCYSILTACIQWQSYPNQNSVGGIQYSVYVDVPGCQTVCANSPQCVAIDYESTNSRPCWLHLNSDDLLPNNTYITFGIIQYVISRNCQTSTTSGKLVLSVPDNGCYQVLNNLKVAWCRLLR